MRLLSEKLPEIPLVAAFETGFHQTIPDRNRYYAVPYEWAEKLSRQAVGLSRREPSLHRHADGRAAGPQRSADHLLPPRRLELAVRDSRRQERGDHDGHEPADRACRTTTASAISIRSRLPVIMQATGKTLDEVLDDAGRAERPAGPERRQRRRARPGRSGRRRATRERKLALDVFIADIRQSPGRHAGRTRRRRRDRVHRRHRRERRQHSHGRVSRTSKSWASSSIREPNAAAKGEVADQRRRQPHADLDHADERRD